ncbi:DUF916 domain-containing protein [Microbacterium chocolatum]|uniref:WxL protein peptidoglycan domain-containing protein n=1 Tax=Microbacterium aurantiacum TaxID=162393 RepID=UPI0033901CAF
MRSSLHASRVAASVVGVTLALLGGAAVAPAVHAAEDEDRITWSVTPADESGPDRRGVIEQELDPGASAEDFFAVRNSSRVPVTFTLSAADGFYNDNGRFNMLPSDQESVDAGTWIDLPETVTVEPNGTVVVPFTTTVPEDAIPGDHVAGVAASVLSVGTDESGSQVGVESRVGFRVLTRVSGDIVASAEVGGVVTDYTLAWNPIRPGEMTASFDVTNTGNANVIVAGEVGAGTGVVVIGEEDGARQTLLPGETRRVEVLVPGVWPTFYVPVEITLVPEGFDLGGDAVPVEPITASATAWAIPVPQLLILFGLALIIGALFWGRRRSQNRMAAAIAAAREEGRAAAAQNHRSDDVPLPSGGSSPHQ